jgi:hypothetical protein
MLGWFYRYQTPPIELLQHELVPIASSRHARRLGRSNDKTSGKSLETAQANPETWLCGYFSFLREVLKLEKSTNPTQQARCAFSLSQVLYTGEVETKVIMSRFL